MRFHNEYLITEKCFMALNSTKTFWNASVTACSDHGAFLVEFDDDKEVQGLIKLINKGRHLFCIILLIVFKFFN